jgi:HAD superfamily hydrolase (TIGR01484 family)
MDYVALASDYDGTLAQDGRVSQSTLAALWRFKETGRRLLLVTGRLLPDLKAVFPEYAIFDKIVVENGALLYSPASDEERLLAPAPPNEFVERLRALGVAPLSMGRCIVSTWEPNEGKVLAAVRDLGLELEIIFNKGAVMVLPSGVNKATGLAAALRELALAPHNVVGVGDAENDRALLGFCGCGAAVANALPMLKEAADIVLDKARGEGVAELIDRMLDQDADLLPGGRRSSGLS